MDKTITLIARCPICGSEVLRRTWDKVPDQMSEPLTDEAVQARRRDARADRKLYWSHLTTQHPERFDESAS